MAASHPAFVHELPVFVAEIRQLFTPDEINEHLAIFVPSAQEAARADAEAGEDEFEAISPQELDTRLERLSLMTGQGVMIARARSASSVLGLVVGARMRPLWLAALAR